MVNFRYDINGLRAWAVMAVILFHFGIPGFEGGFVGVDVFFVISGYLMTKIVINGLSNSSAGKPFSVFAFYLSRAKRILPALIFLCAALLIFGWFFFPATDYKTLAVHVIAALLFVSNIFFWREAGYFDVASHEKLLLHTWSLSVEWQFYLLFPLILAVLWKIRPKLGFIGIALIVGCLLSLCLSIVMTPAKSWASFFLLPTRAWEMLAGGIVYLYCNKLVLRNIPAKLIESIGFACILFAIFVFEPSDAWPGWKAIVPVAGAMLILISARTNSFYTRSHVAQWLGNTSYSLYLWHWPFSGLLFYVDAQEYWPAIVAGFVFTAIMGGFSYFFIENPARKSLGKINAVPATFVIVFVIVLISLPSLYIRQLKGVTGRLPEHIEQIFAEVNNKNPKGKECTINLGPDRNRKVSELPECTYGGEELGLIVIGDSHAQSILISAAKALPSPDLHVLDWTIIGCPTILGVRTIDKTVGDSCASFGETVLAKSKVLPDHVPILIVNRIMAHLENVLLPNPTLYFSEPYSVRTTEYYHEMQQGIIETACTFAQYRPVYILRPVPELILDVPRYMGRARLLGWDKRISISLEEYQERNKVAMEAYEQAAESCGVTLLDPLPYLCSDGYCWGDVNGQPVYYDDDHLSIRGADLLIPLFRQMFNN